ncbi:MAG TPA: DNA topology modulation protein FlaR [Clostridia bacterium]|nr:DNA topology modulation protein FlaR [Clostridia bacterium]
MIDKIYITGPVGAGKSTLARRLAKEFGFACCELDSVVYEPDPTKPNGNRKRTIAARDALLEAALSGGRWVAEDAGRAYFEHLMQRADSIILLEPPAAVRLWRIVRRWIRQNLGLEACGYTPDWGMLKLMFRWTRQYETDADGVRARAAKYTDKVSLIRNERDIRRYVRERIEPQKTN